MTQRTGKLISSFPEYNIDAFLVTKDVNIRYLTKFQASESWLLVTKKESYYITDFRYILEAKQKLKDGVKIVQYTDSMTKTLFELAEKLRIQKIGFDEQWVSLSQYRKILKDSPKGVKLVATANAVEQLRSVKEAEEILNIRQALDIHKKALQYVKRFIKPNVTERFILDKLEEFIKVHEAGFSFSPIVASGPNSAFPHAVVSDRKLRNNEPVLLDMGIDLKGYKSDLTRIFLLGRISPLVEKVYRLVDEARRRAIAAVKAGADIRDVDSAARNFLEENKLAKYFGHALGHGVGLEIHELPRISQKNPSHLLEGMIITIEPAVYLPHQFGIRIEDMVLVTKKGCEILSDNIH